MPSLLILTIQEAEPHIMSVMHGPNLTVDGVSGNMNVFYRKTTPNRVNVSQYHTDNYGLSFGLGIPVAKDHRLSSSIGYEHIKIQSLR